MQALQGTLYFHIILIMCISSSITTAQERDEAVQTTTTSTRESTRQYLQDRQRHMLQMIQRNFMLHTGWRTLPNVRSRDIPIDPDILRNLTTVERHCYAPSCRLPNYISLGWWNNRGDNSMKLFFSLISRISEDVVIRNATLTLYAKPRSECQCEHIEEEDVRLIIEVYQFCWTQRTPKHIRRCLLDSKYIEWRANSGGQWMHFDVAAAASAWTNNNNSRRYPKRLGLAVQVLRLRNGRLSQFNARNLFADVNCTRQRTLDLVCFSTTTRQLFNSFAPVMKVFSEVTPVLTTRFKRETNEDLVVSEDHKVEKL